MMIHTQIYSYPVRAEYMNGYMVMSQEAEMKEKKIFTMHSVMRQRITD